MKLNYFFCQLFSFKIKNVILYRPVCNQLKYCSFRCFLLHLNRNRLFSTSGSILLNRVDFVHAFVGLKQISMLSLVRDWFLWFWSLCLTKNNFWADCCKPVVMLMQRTLICILRRVIPFFRYRSDTNYIFRECQNLSDEMLWFWYNEYSRRKKYYLKSKIF